MQKSNVSGYIGVSKQDNRWIGNISVHGVQNYLGCFMTPQEAVIARNKYITENNLTEYLIQYI